jgi:thymidylate synthase
MPTIELYNPEDNPVCVGKGGHAALCTAWDDWEDLIKENPGLEDAFAIIGTLRGPSGIAPLIRNLALNPHVSEILVWTDGKHSQQVYGHTGIDLLFALWEKGINDDGTIPGTPFQLEKEVPPQLVRSIVADVALHAIRKEGGAISAHEIPSYVRSEPRTASRPVQSFPEPPFNNEKRWPSEGAGSLFRGSTIVEAWTRLIAGVLRYGTRKGSQHGKQCELLNATWTIDGEKPEAISFPEDWPEALRLLTGTTEKQLAGYLPQILTPDCEDGTYGKFLFAYPTKAGPLDQIEMAIIAGFRNSPDCRRGVATTLVPEIHAGASDPPCLDLVQCLQADGRLNLTAYFRSHDIMKAALANAVALRHLQKAIAGRLGFEVGSMTILSASAHVYKVDWEQADRLVKCAAGRNPAFPFTAGKADPRGNIIVKVEGILIRVQLVSPDGGVLWQHAGEWPADVAAKIAQLGLITDAQHLLYIGGELARAREAILNRHPYYQL